MLIKKISPKSRVIKKEAKQINTQIIKNQLFATNLVLKIASKTSHHSP
jgi:hypothetical protein